MSDEHNTRSAQPLKPGLVALTAGALIFWLATTAMFVLVDADFWSGTTAERAAEIDDHMSAWRTTWAVAMPGELLVGIGLLIVGVVLSRQRVGIESVASWIVAAAGVAHIPIGIARFATSLSDGDYAADPGTWFDALWGAHFISLALASFLLAWLGWGTLVPRWISIVMVIFTLLGAVMLTPATIYFPPIVAFGVAALLRLRTTTNVQSAPALTGN